MSMLEPIWDARAPTPADVRRMWHEVRFETMSFDAPALDETLNALRRTRTSGGALLACFYVLEHPVFDYFASRNLLGEHGEQDPYGLEFFRRFLGSPAVARALPEVTLFNQDGSPLDDYDLELPPVFDWGSSFTLDGEIAESVVRGGAYIGFAGMPAGAKRLGRRFCDAIFGERFTEVQVYKSYDRWHEWFHYFEHTTWLLIDKRHRKIWLLCLTETD